MRCSVHAAVAGCFYIAYLHLSLLRLGALAEDPHIDCTGNVWDSLHEALRYGGLSNETLLRIAQESLEQGATSNDIARAHMSFWNGGASYKANETQVYCVYGVAAAAITVHRLTGKPVPESILINSGLFEYELLAESRWALILSISDIVRAMRKSSDCLAIPQELMHGHHGRQLRHFYTSWGNPTLTPRPRQTPLRVVFVGLHAGVALSFANSLQSLAPKSQIYFLGFYLWCNVLNTCDEPLARSVKMALESDPTSPEVVWEALGEAEHIMSQWYARHIRRDGDKFDLLVSVGPQPAYYSTLAAQVLPSRLNIFIVDAPALCSEDWGFKFFPASLETGILQLRKAAFERSDLIAATFPLSAESFRQLTGIIIPVIPMLSTSAESWPGPVSSTLLLAKSVLLETRAGRILEQWLRRSVRRLRQQQPKIKNVLTLRWSGKTGTYLSFKELSSVRAAIYFQDAPSKVGVLDLQDAGVPLFVSNREFFIRARAAFAPAIRLACTTQALESTNEFNHQLEFPSNGVEAAWNGTEHMLPFFEAQLPVRGKPWIPRRLLLALGKYEEARINWCLEPPDWLFALYEMGIVHHGPGAHKFESLSEVLQIASDDYRLQYMSSVALGWKMQKLQQLLSFWNHGIELIATSLNP